MSLNPPLLALAIGAFGIGVTEFAPMGMLPVIAGDSSRKRTARATSSGVDERCSGVMRCARPKASASIGPDGSVMPGATPTTRSRGASAIASIVVAACSAAFDSV